MTERERKRESKKREGERERGRKRGRKDMKREKRGIETEKKSARKEGDTNDRESWCNKSFLKSFPLPTISLCNCHETSQILLVNPFITDQTKKFNFFQSAPKLFHCH